MFGAQSARSGGRQGWSCGAGAASSVGHQKATSRHQQCSGRSWFEVGAAGLELWGRATLSLRGSSGMRSHERRKLAQPAATGHTQAQVTSSTSWHKQHKQTEPAVRQIRKTGSRLVPVLVGVWCGVLSAGEGKRLTARSGPSHVRLPCPVRGAVCAWCRAGGGAWLRGHRPVRGVRWPCTPPDGPAGI